MNTIELIPVHNIEPNPENPRKKINPDELNELAESIKAVGMLQPITVRRRFLVIDTDTDDGVVAQFEAVARRNPDFFILDEKNIYMSDEDKMICSKLKELGFRFDKGRGDSNAYRDVKRKTKFDISDPTIAGFSFGWKGFFGPERTEDEIMARANSNSRPWKHDWYLNRMANNREEKMAEIRMDILRERVSEMPDHAERLARVKE